MEEAPAKTKNALKVQKRQENKFRKKEKKAQSMIAQQEGKPISELLSSTPTRYCYLPYFGAGSYVTFENLEAFLVKEFPGFEKLTVQKSKAHAMVTFSSPEDAVVAHEKLHGKTPEELNQPMIIFFAKDAPVEEAVESTQVTGLHLVEDFITPEEETELINFVESCEGEWEVLNRRTVKHWGYTFDYVKNTVDRESKNDNFPPLFRQVREKMKSLDFLPFEPDQITVNVYEPGAGIPQHVETHSAFEDGLVSLSLASQVVMELKHPDGTVASVPLPRRSILVLTGESRFLWSHGICGRKSDTIGNVNVERKKRISLTFRKVRDVEHCDCKYQAQCNSWVSEFKGSQQDNTKIEDQYVKEVYNSIAPHFSDTRHKPWPKITQFLKDQPYGSLVCDVGCGNGKYLGVADNVYTIGNDQSVQLLKIASERGHQVAVCNNLYLPFRSESFDVVISIAVIHHFSTKEHREQALRELVRVLKPGGKLLVYVWAMEQEEKTFGQQDVLVPWNMEKKYVEQILDQSEGETKEKIQSLISESPAVTKQNKEYVVFQRYYHVFRKGELPTLLRKIEGLEVGPEEFDHANWTVVCTKL
eukprot:TRINITY_DN623_c0_g1_i1.p1 TRINITY_DN623_c0_g1~~TRINITY_DN623_c0_g1_i1.p1  ORF type:complete len:587 (-),score=140.48 TRINITY_DN623_c0_g1_i1:24-1784(-)